MHRRVILAAVKDPIYDHYRVDWKKRNAMALLKRLLLFHGRARRRTGAMRFCWRGPAQEAASYRTRDRFCFAPFCRGTLVSGILGLGAKVNGIFAKAAGGAAICLWALLFLHGAEDPGSGPYVLVLGTAQDGGLPQIGCGEAICREAKQTPARRRLVSSLALVDPSSEKRWLFDATPDIREQVAMLQGRAGVREHSAGRPPLFDGVFLTHAHMGHYSGLVHLGREAYNHPAIPVYASRRMCAFLRDNGPWDLLIRNQNLVLKPFEMGKALTLGDGLKVTPLEVPHRDEYSDTVGFVLQGPRRSLLFIPDIDKWERWPRDINALIASVDMALLDGTFFADGEIPGRAMADIPHPFIEESIARFENLPTRDRDKIYFIHLNHTNPAAQPGSKARVRIEAVGMHVAEDGQRFSL